MDSITAIENRKFNVAMAAGVDLDRVKQVRLDIGKLLDAGLLIDIDLHGFSCLKTGVSWEELGINGGDERRSRLTTGTKYLAPAEYVKRLTSLEVRFRQALDKYSFDVDGFKPWRWLPFTAYDEWRHEWESLKAELAEFKHDLAAAWDNILDENRRYFEGVAKTAWRAYQAPYDGQAAVVAGGYAFETYAAFEVFIVESALARMPRLEFIENCIFPDYKTGYMITPPEIMTLYAQQEAARAEADKLAAEAQAEWQAVQRTGLELSAREMEIKAKATAVRQAELEHTRKQLAELTSPLAEITAKFRARIYESVVGAAQSLQKNGNLRGKTAEMLAGLQTLYHTLASATNDTQLEDALAAVQDALDKAPAPGQGKYDLEAVESALAGVIALTQDAAESLKRNAVQTTRAGMLELD